MLALRLKLNKGICLPNSGCPRGAGEAAERAEGAAGGAKEPTLDGGGGEGQAAGGDRGQTEGDRGNEVRLSDLNFGLFVTLNDLCDLFQGFCDGEGGAEQAAPGGNGGGQAQDGGQWD